jgi:nanoRNase/pAp phosphatase (c-di-AMP/oligoRNAs hydrolase)
MLTLEQQIFKQIEKSENILIVFNADWNGDAVASALALLLFLKKIGKQVEIAADINQADQSKQKDSSLWRFLPSYNNIQTALKNLRKFIVSLDISQATINQIKYTVDGQKLNFIISPEKGWFSPEDISSSSSGFKYDLIFTIDTPDLESLAAIYDNNVEFFYKTTIINLDHQAGNEEYGQINYIDLNVASTAETLFQLLKQREEEILDEDIATCLLTGIISKTKNYKSANLTPRTLLTSSKLIGLGARREEIINQLYRSRPLSVLKSWGKILNQLQTDNDKRLIWSLLEGKDAEALNEEALDPEELVEEIITSIPEAKLILIAVSATDQKSLKVYAYAVKGVSAVEMLKTWQGNGNARSAQALLNLNSEEWQNTVIPIIKEKLDKNFG